MFGIFNRSHYEDVLVARVRKLAPQEVWKARYRQINDFEALLAATGTIVLKFFLHISKSEQKERLLKRESDPSKAWKLSAGDWDDHARWDDYMRAYEDALGKCSTSGAPWYIVPANRKWYRDLAVCDIVVETLRRQRAAWRTALEAMSKTRLAELKAIRRRSK
jgi:polyphosphate kinase 2 (PPK2 family)